MKYFFIFYYVPCLILFRVCKKMETDQKRICEEVLGKNEQPSMEDVLKAVQSLKKYTNNKRKIVII